jgi:hypothetical protein
LWRLRCSAPQVSVVAAIPALGILAGAATGLLLPSLPAIPTFAILICCGALSFWAWRAGNSLALAVAVAAGFFAGGTLLTADAWQRAWRPSLRIAFEELARSQRAQADAEGRRLPDDDEAFAVVEGTLRADAARAETGVSLSGGRRAPEAGKAGRQDRPMSPSHQPLVPPIPPSAHPAFPVP